MDKRIESVDIFRILAIISVIIIHTTPFAEIRSSVLYNYISVMLNQGARFAVPFFFVIAGFFYGLKLKYSYEINGYTLLRIRRLLFLWLAWSLIYALPYQLHSFVSNGILGPVKLAYWHLCGLLSHPINLLFEGTKVHLWFLNALVWSTIISWLFISIKRVRILVIISVGLYVFGMLAKSYAETPLGFHINFNTRNGPFFGTLLFVTGYILSKKTPQPSWFYKGIFIFSIGTIVHFTEIYLLWKYYNHYPMQHDYVLGTFFMGLGTALMALSSHSVLNPFFNLSKIGRLTLGIYCIHFIFVDNLRIFERFNNPIFDVLFVILVFILSFYFSVVLSRNKYLYKLVC
jgi:surface polysaccharide O-acyltransferase-like enzyme